MSIRRRSITLAIALGCIGGGCGGDSDSRPPDAGQDGSRPAPAGESGFDAGHGEAGRPAPQPEAAMPDEDAGADPPPSDAGPVADAAPPKPPPGPPLARFDPPARGFSGSLSLQLSAADSGDLVHYTLDGSLPSADSPLYGGPITLGATTLVRARALRGAAPGAVLDQLYVQLADDARGFESNLPVLIVHRLGGEEPSAESRAYVPGALLQLEPGEGGRTRLNGPATHSTRIGLKIRGRSTRNQPKHSFTMELWGEAEEDREFGLLGMPPDGDWVLYAPYIYDRAMIRNTLMYELSNRIGRYAPRTRFCEVFLVTGVGPLAQTHYHGVYALTERIQRGSQRVAVAKLGPEQIAEPDVSGGYIFQKDQPDAPEEAFAAADDTFVYVDPDADEIVPAQTQYLVEYLDGWRRAIDDGDGVDPETGTPYRELMDSASFIDHHILSMLAKNPDSFALSAYYHKDRGGPLRAGPLWDLDLSMGAHDPFGERSRDPEQWGPGSDDEIFTREPYGALFTHSDFEDAYWARWDALLGDAFTTVYFDSLIDSWRQTLTEAETRNRARWPESTPRNGSFEEETDALQGWLAERLAWIQAHKGEVPW